MLSKEMFKKDNRFHVNDIDIDRIFEKRVDEYKICKMKVGDIRRAIGKKVVSLYDTEVYKYLDKQTNDDEYADYCKNHTHKNEGHSVDSFNDLIKKYHEYDLKKAAIVVNQFGIVLDGLHRSCILLKEFGPEYEIEVVKICRKGLHLKTRIKLIIKAVREL